MNQQYLVIANWEKYQHYGNRLPPWIKLHRSVIEPFNADGKPNPFYHLSDPAKLALMLIWVKASQHSGVILLHSWQHLAREIGVKNDIPFDELLESKLVRVVSNPSKIKRNPAINVASNVASTEMTNLLAQNKNKNKRKRKEKEKNGADALVAVPATATTISDISDKQANKTKSPGADLLNSIDWSEWPMLNTGRFREGLVEFVEYRREIKKPMNQRAVAILLGKARSMGEAAAVVAMREAILNTWTGIWEPKPGDMALDTDHQTANIATITQDEIREALERDRLRRQETVA